MKEKYQSLFESTTLQSGIELKNRVVMAPMTHYSSNDDGTISDAELTYYAPRAKGVSMVITACANVTPNGKAFSGQPGVDRDELLPGLRKLASTIKEQGAKAVLQIHHGGRHCPPELIPNQDIVSASAVETNFEKTARELTEAEIHEIIQAFGEATRRAIEAGFDGVEIHGANGYLIHQFFSPYTNRREDQWGGTIEKRLSFPLAIINEVKKAVRSYATKPFIVGYRLSPEEAETPGITMADTLVLLDALADQDLDYIHISLNEYWSIPRRGTEDKRTRLEIIQEYVGDRVPVIGVGSIYTAEDALNALQSGTRLIALGRELIIDPEWVNKIETDREDEIVTALSPDDQENLLIPDPLWKPITNVTGWFPFKK